MGHDRIRGSGQEPVGFQILRVGPSHPGPTWPARIDQTREKPRNFAAVKRTSRRQRADGVVGVYVSLLGAPVSAGLL